MLRPLVLGHLKWRRKKKEPNNFAMQPFASRPILCRHPSVVGAIVVRHSKWRGVHIQKGQDRTPRRCHKGPPSLFPFPLSAAYPASTFLNFVPRKFPSHARRVSPFIRNAKFSAENRAARVRVDRGRRGRQAARTHDAAFAAAAVGKEVCDFASLITRWRSNAGRNKAAAAAARLQGSLL